MRDRIVFHLNGQRVEVGGDEVFLSLSDFLRKRRGLTGTKVVCAEGDCGSCTVLIGRAEAGELRYAAVTSCIQIVFQLDGTHVVTVEGLREGTELNPIQRAMVSCHGAQCGFCTPGFVVALHGMMHDGDAVDAEKIRRGLTGNLCRCTGYDSIIRSAMQVDRASVKSVAAMYSSVKTAVAEAVRIQTADRLFYQPVSVESATRFKKDNPGCNVIAGATDLGVVYNKRLRQLNVAMTLGAIASLREVRVDADAIRLGATCTLSTLQTIAQQHLPELSRFMDWFGSPLIRNAGTIGGNLVTGSPIGDTIPAMTVLGAQIEITGAGGVRVVPIDKFYTGYRQTVLAADELVTAITIPKLKAGELLKLYKVSRRKDLDISSFGAAIWIKTRDEMIEEIRLAFGGVGPMVMRMTRTEALLRGKPATLENFEAASEIAFDEVKPISDVRGSADYRRTLARNILLKFWHETFAGETSSGCTSGAPG